MFGGGENRKGFVREAVPGFERTISLGVLLLVVGVGAAIYLSGQSYDPKLFGLDPALLDRPDDTVRKQVRLVEPANEGVSEEPSATGPGVTLSDLVPDGWRTLGAAEYFDADDLYVKINGRAEQYLAYDVVGLSCLSLADSDDRFIDVFVYDMGSPIQAFGIYSVERSEGRTVTALGRDGYQAAASLFFWKGGYYAQILAAGRDDALVRAAESIARTLADRLADNGDPVWGLSAFPTEGRVEGSTQYFMRDALSLDFLQNTFTTRYSHGGSEVTAFLSRQSSEEAAARAMASYQAYITDYGEPLAVDEASKGRMAMGDMGGFYDIVFISGTTVGGITMAEDRALAESTARTLIAHTHQR